MIADKVKERKKQDLKYKKLTSSHKGSAIFLKSVDVLLTMASV